MIRIPLDLSKHCLQTETRRHYHRLLSVCLKSPEKNRLAEKKLELLKQVLETWDFSSLRAEYKALAGGQENDVVLLADETGRMSIVIDDQTISI